MNIFNWFRSYKELSKSHDFEKYTCPRESVIVKHYYELLCTLEAEYNRIADKLANEASTLKALDILILNDKLETTKQHILEIFNKNGWYPTMDNFDDYKTAMRLKYEDLLYFELTPVKKEPNDD
jgi:hypothetical protein